jgi:L,D-peptidoglycan transpeptidase YkuD (ErfK/YbiS/YcfS/YnhG family)
MGGVAFVSCVALSACSSSAHPLAVRKTPPPSSTSSSTPPTYPASSTSTTARSVTTTTAPRATTTTDAPTTTSTLPVRTTTTTAPPPPAPTPTTSPLLVNQLVGVDGAKQVVAVVAEGYGDTTATLTAYQEGPSGWTQVFGPWSTEVGEDGFAPPGEKREGDLRTPSGSYPFGFFFGIDPDPGVMFPWRAISPSDYWNDDPSSANYNQWIDEAVSGTAAAGTDPEPMDDPPYYDYGAVIDYNTDPVVSDPPMGSAIFFHYTPPGVPTVGCVALPDTNELLAVLRWLNPADDPRIIMGTASAVEQ